MKNSLVRHHRVTKSKWLMLIFKAIAFSFIASYPTTSTAEKAVFRGFNAGPQLTESDIDDLAKIGANLLRVSFTKDIPLLNKNPPHQINEAALEKLDNIIAWCETRAIRVIIDPHSAPGMANPNTATFEDEFWLNKTYQERLADLWSKIAKRYKDRGDVIFGYDLLNEPVTLDGYAGGPGSWNEILERLVFAIRASGDAKHAIIIEPASGWLQGKFIDRIRGLAYLKIPNDQNIIVSPHFYRPHTFTHQGIESDIGTAYPGHAESEYWDIRRIKLEFDIVADFQRRTGRPILVGEFSASMLSGKFGENYLNDVISAIEEHSWHWAYHDFRGSPYWDTEYSYTSQSGINSLKPSQRSLDSRRMVLIRGYLQRNRVQMPIAR